jgi:uncharacterized protein (DUF58 family)
MARDFRPARVLGRRYHFHSAGVAYAVTTMVLVIGAINGQNNLLFWLFGLGVAGLIVSGVLSGGSLMRLEIEREAPAASGVGDEVVIRYRVRNRSRVFPAFGLTIEELASVRGGRFSGDWSGRLSAPVAFAAYVPARGSVVVEARAGALKRGTATLGPVRIWTTFPFGLTKKSKSFFQESTVLVRPRLAPLRPGIVEGVLGRGDLGSVLRKSRGGEEFYSLREYSQGDSLRSVAWRSTARLGYAVVREMASRPSRHLWIALDFGDAGEIECERAVSVAAALAVRAVDAGLEPGLAVSGRVFEAARGGRRHLAHLLDSLGGMDVHWLREHARELAALDPSVYRQDAFIVVQAGSSASGADGAARAFFVGDSSGFLETGWTPIIAAGNDDRNGLARRIGSFLGAALGRKEGA